MMTTNRLLELAQQGDLDGLLDAVISNGRPVPLGVRLRLSQGISGDGRGGGAIGAALGLALSRVVELSYLPGAEGSALAAMLLEARRDDGWFGSFAATACAASALRAFERQLEFSPESSERRRVSQAADDAMHALITRTRGSSGPDAVDLAIILWSLNGNTRAGESWWWDEQRVRAESMGLTHDRTLSPMIATLITRRRKGGVAA